MARSSTGLARAACGQHAKDAGAVVAAINVVAQEDDDRRAGQPGVFDGARFQKRYHVGQEIGAAVDVADGIPYPPVEKSRDGGFWSLEEPQHAHAAMTTFVIQVRNGVPELRSSRARQP